MLKDLVETVPVLAIIDGELALEALNNNIVILEDPFRTGFECKACDGEGHTKEPCKSCAGSKVIAENTDFNAAAASLSEKDLLDLPPSFVENLRKKRKEQEEEKIVSGGLTACRSCISTDARGGFEISGFEQCKVCKGRGASIVVPETAMNRPTSGTIVSTGMLCTFLKAGDRVVYTNMMGHVMKFKHKDLFRVMREDEIMCRLHGTAPEKFQRKLA